jgi:hypothetical protein
VGSGGPNTERGRVLGLVRVVLGGWGRLVLQINSVCGTRQRGAAQAWEPMCANLLVLCVVASSWLMSRCAFKSRGRGGCGCRQERVRRNQCEGWRWGGRGRQAWAAGVGGRRVWCSAEAESQARAWAWAQQQKQQ